MKLGTVYTFENKWALIRGFKDEVWTMDKLREFLRDGGLIEYLHAYGPIDLGSDWKPFPNISKMPGKVHISHKEDRT